MTASPASDQAEQQGEDHPLVAYQVADGFPGHEPKSIAWNSDADSTWAGCPRECSTLICRLLLYWAHDDRPGRGAARRRGGRPAHGLGFAGRLTVVEAALTIGGGDPGHRPDAGAGGASRCGASGESFRVGTLAGGADDRRLGPRGRPAAPAGGRARRQAGRAGAGRGRRSPPPTGRSGARRPRSRRRAGSSGRPRSVYLAARLGPRRLARLAVDDRARLHRPPARGGRGGGARRAVGAEPRAARGASVLPNFDALRAFAAGYRRWLCQTAWALLAAAHAVNAALIAVFTDMTSAQSGTLLALTRAGAAAADGCLVPLAASAAPRPIERYLDAAVRRPPTRGPARDDPDAVAAFRAAQGLPYRLAGYQALAVRLRRRRGGGRRAAGCAASTPRRPAGCWARARSCCWRWRSTRRCCCATCCGRCSASSARATACRSAEVRAPITLRTKLVLFFSSVTVFTVGAGAAVRAVAHATRRATMVASIAAGAGAGAGAGAAHRARHGDAGARARGALGRDGARRAGAAGAARRARPTRSGA